MESSHASLPPGMMMAGSEVAHRFSAGQQHGAPASATPLTTTGLCKGIELKNNNQVAGSRCHFIQPFCKCRSHGLLLA